MRQQAGAGVAAGAFPVVVVGASVRGFAQSAAAAGWDVYAADLFADHDLRLAARAVVRAADVAGSYPESLAVAAERFPHAPWCYTGAVENHPNLIDTMAGRRRLAGNDGRRVRAIRDPARVAAAARDAGLSFPDTHRHPAGLPVDGSFLVKPVASAGGRGIRRWHGGQPPGEPAVWQRHIPGSSVAAAFVCDGRRARLLSITRQLVGLACCHAAPFAYCGSLRGTARHPLDGVPDAAAEAWARFGDVLAATFGLIGVIGVDAVVDAEGRLWIIEVNPRPTASMELHERATGESIAALHLHACGVPGPPSARLPAADACWAKAVLHAPHECRVDAALAGRWAAWAAEWAARDGGWAAVADLPVADQTIRPRAPLLTVFARGAVPEEAWTRLEARVAEIGGTLPAAPTPPSGAACPPPPAARCIA